jgi:N-acetylmuramoyl-L-alanine amidase
MVHLGTLSMPSCLIEVGFLSSDREQALLIDSEYQDKIARGIVNGIERFFML